MVVDQKLFGGAKKQKTVISRGGNKWKPTEEKNPDNAGNKSRNGFTYHHLLHPKGRFFQFKIKPIIMRLLLRMSKKIDYEAEGDLKIVSDILTSSMLAHIGDEAERERKQAFCKQAIDTFIYYTAYPQKLEKDFKNPAVKTAINSAWLGARGYDHDAFVYEDERLIKFSGVVDFKVKEYFDCNQIVIKTKDVFLFLMKEDIYYRPRFIKILQEIYPTLEFVDHSTNPLLNVLFTLSKLSQDFSYSPEEIENMERWT